MVKYLRSFQSLSLCCARCVKIGVLWRFSSDRSSLQLFVSFSFVDCDAYDWLGNWPSGSVIGRRTSKATHYWFRPSEIQRWAMRQQGNQAETQQDNTRRRQSTLSPPQYAMTQIVVSVRFNKFNL